MNCLDYYKQMGVDITHLPIDVRNTIASFFLENMIFSKEEIETIFRASLEKKRVVVDG